MAKSVEVGQTLRMQFQIHDNRLITIIISHYIPVIASPFTFII